MHLQGFFRGNESNLAKFLVIHTMQTPSQLGTNSGSECFKCLIYLLVLSEYTHVYISKVLIVQHHNDQSIAHAQCSSTTAYSLSVMKWAIYSMNHWKVLHSGYFSPKNGMNNFKSWQWLTLKFTSISGRNLAICFASAEEIFEEVKCISIKHKVFNVL